MSWEACTRKWSQKLREKLANSQQSSEFDALIEDDKRRISLLSQLREVGWDKIRHLDPELDHVTFIIDQDDANLDLAVRIPSKFPSDPFVIDSSLGLNISPKARLSQVLREYSQKVDLYKPIRQVLCGLESKTRVLEPSTSLWDPKRIVALAPGICVEVTLDPTDPVAAPKILILGPDRKIQPLLAALSVNIGKYDPEVNLALNLERILEVELPLPLQNNQSSLDTESVECGICYVYQLGQALPTEVCDNERCGQPFHSECLYEHLSTCHGATKSHNTVFGKCPFCESDIFCNIVQKLK